MNLQDIQAKLYIEDAEKGGNKKSQSGAYLSKYSTEDDYSNDICLFPCTTSPHPWTFTTGRIAIAEIL